MVKELKEVHHGRVSSSEREVGRERGEEPRHPGGLNEGAVFCPQGM